MNPIEQGANAGPGGGNQESNDNKAKATDKTGQEVASTPDEDSSLNNSAPKASRFRPFTELAHFVTSAKSAAATLALAIVLVACSPKGVETSKAEQEYNQAVAQYIERDPKGEKQLQFARDVVMRRDHQRMLKLSPELPGNYDEFKREIYDPLQEHVKEKLDKKRAKTDPVGAVKEAMYSYISPNLLFNGDYDVMFAPLDPKQPRGQCLACTMLAATLLTDPDIGALVPEGTTPVIVYTDKHEFLGMLDNESRVLETHEFAARGTGDPVNWGSLEETSIPRPTMQVAKLVDVLDGIVRGTKPPYLFDNMPDKSEDITGGKPGVGVSNVGFESGGQGSSSKGRTHGQLGGFDSGKIQIPPGDRAFPQTPPSSPAAYMNVGGVYASSGSGEGDFAQSLGQQRQAQPDLPSLSELQERALSNLSLSERRELLDLVRHSEPLRKLRNTAARAADVLFDSSNLSREEEVLAKKIISTSAQTIEQYWKNHNIEELTKRTRDTWGKFIAEQRKGYVRGEVVWDPGHPANQRAVVRAWCKQAGIPLPR